MSRFFTHDLNTSSWTLPGGLAADDDDDQRRLEDFFHQNPDFREAALRAVRDGALSAMAAAASMTCGAEPHAKTTAAVFAHGQARPAALPDSVQTPSNPTRFAAAIAKFTARRDDSDVRKRTTEDQVTALRNLSIFLAKHKPHLEEDQWVHEIDTTHISEFLDEEKKRPGRGEKPDGTPLPIKAATLKKRLLDLGTFFRYARKELKACVISPVDDLDDRLEDLGRVAGRTASPYSPFCDDQIELIFEPSAYLANNRDPDYFWVPLLAAHLGGRLGEFVLPTLDEIGQDAHGVWYLAVRESFAKTDNSVRLIPLTQPLIDLGFLDYVSHVRQLGAKQLWPNRDLTTPTAQSKPTKNQSQTFGAYLTKRGLVSRRLVFHSFRHTVVNALLDAGTPVHMSMQLCGHEAQDAAIERGLISESASRSVHLGTYSQADLPRLGKKSPLLAMQQALEAAVHLPIDYQRLAIAAQVVLNHTRKVGGKFVTGWPAQRVKYTASQVARLRPASDHAAGTQLDEKPVTAEMVDRAVQFSSEQHYVMNSTTKSLTRPRKMS